METMEMVEVSVQERQTPPQNLKNKKNHKRKQQQNLSPNYPYSQLLVPATCRPAIIHLKTELGLRSGGEVFVWLLRQVRPDLAPPVLPPQSQLPSPKKSMKEKEDSSPIALCMEPCSDDKMLPESVSRVPIRVTVVQASTLFFDTPGTLDKAEKLVASAAACGSQLVVFPEAFVGGYPTYLSFDATAPVQLTETEDDAQKYYASAIDVPGPEVDRLAKIAATYKVHLVIGVVQRVGFCLYNVVLLFDSQGQLLGQQHCSKTRNNSGTSVTYGDNQDPPPVYVTSIGNILIGGDNNLPLQRSGLYSKGIGIYCAPSSDAREVWNMAYIAVEGGCFVLSANQFCKSGDYPLSTGDSVACTPENVPAAGGSVIISPSGKILAGPNYQGECLISADIDLEEIVTAKSADAGVKGIVGPDYGFCIEGGPVSVSLAEN